MLDSYVASQVIRERSPIMIDRLSAILPSLVCISAMTRAELLLAVARLPDSNRMHVAVRQFLRTVRVLPWDGDAADHYAAMRHQLMTARQSIGEMDLMIAAHSLAAGATLVTTDLRRYRPIEAPLTLVSWSASDERE
jgi:tRNA(fMet)-specific endonuclease VapC